MSVAALFSPVAADPVVSDHNVVLEVDEIDTVDQKSRWLASGR